MENKRLNEFLQLHSAFEGSLSVAITKKLRQETTKKARFTYSVVLKSISSNTEVLTKTLNLKVVLTPFKIEYIEYEFCEVDADFDTIVNDIKDLIINKL